MPGPETTEDFLRLLRVTGVVQIKDAEAAADELPESSPTVLADRLVSQGLLTRFQANRLLRGQTKRYFLGKYVILEPLTNGLGGFLGEHKIMKRRVALKLLPPKHSEKVEVVHAFQETARKVSALEHHHLARAYDLNEDSGFHFVVTEHLEGRSLKTTVEKHGPLNSYTILHQLYAVTNGLQYLHENGLAHGSVLPGHILTDRNGVIKLLEPALAPFLDAQADSLHQPTAEEDMLQLGQSLVFMLTGKPPNDDSELTFTEHTPDELKEVANRLLQKPGVEPIKQPAELLPLLQNLLKEWQKPQLIETDRMQSGSQPVINLEDNPFQELDLEYEATPPPPKKKPPEPVEPTGERKRKYTTPAIAIGVMILGLAVAWQFRPKNDPVDPVELNTTWYVEPNGSEVLSPNPARTLSTFRGALEQARSGETIILLADLNEPPLAASGRRNAGPIHDLQIKTLEPSQIVRWQPTVTTGSATTPILSLRDFEGLTISNLEIDCQNEFAYGITVAGSSSGSALHNLRIKNATESAVRLRSVSASEDKPFLLKDCHFEAEDRPHLVAIDGLCQHIRLENCCLVGPVRSAIQIDGSVRGLSVKNSLIHNGNVGFAYDPSKPSSDDKPANLLFSNNTFSELGRGITVSEQVQGTINIRMNFFRKTRTIYSGPTNGMFELEAEENARDKATSDGSLTPPAEEKGLEEVKVEPPVTIQSVPTPSGYGAK